MFISKLTSIQLKVTPINQKKKKKTEGNHKQIVKTR